jgi:hypothetical protein
MDAPVNSLLLVFAAVAVLLGAYSYRQVHRLRMVVKFARQPQSPTHGPWLPTAGQVSSCLLHEERYYLRPRSGKKGAHDVLCEERYFGRLSGGVIARCPPRPVAEAKSLSEGHEILKLFHEVSTSTERAA